MQIDLRKLVGKGAKVDENDLFILKKILPDEYLLFKELD